jgi:uncharacterized protein YgiM (DUF1202 family)
MLVAKEDGIPVRSDPGFVHRELHQLSRGEEVVVDGRRGEWYHVKPDGWIFQGHLVTKAELAAQSIVELIATKEGARVRETASTDAAVLRTLARGDSVRAKGSKDGWWELVDGGFIADGFVRESGKEAVQEDDQGNAVPWVVGADSANVRASPNTTAAVIRKLGHGEIVPVTSVADGWCEVPGGYVRADLLLPPAAREPVPRRTLEKPAEGTRHWSLVDLQGTAIDIVDINQTAVLQSVREAMRETHVLADDWTYLGISIGVPKDAADSFTYDAEHNTVVVVDASNQKYGNVKLRGPVDKLPMDVRQFFLPMVVNPGEKMDGIILFRPSLKVADITDLSMYFGGRLQQFYPSD